MFLFGKKKFSDEQKLLFQRWHDFTITAHYDLEHVYHTGTQMLASIPIPEFEDDDKLTQLAEELEQEIESYGLTLYHLSRKRVHYVFAGKVDQDSK